MDAEPLRTAVRSIARMPALAAVVIVSLGVGIAANTIVFSWVQAVFLTPIAGAPRAGRLYSIEPRSSAGLYAGVSWPEYRDLRERVRSFGGLIAYGMIPLYVGEPGRVERSSGLLVSDNYFSALGLTPAAGRFFRRDELEKPGGPPIVVVSYDYWQTRFRGDPDLRERRIRVNGAELDVIGVAPRGFKGSVMALTFDFWLPASLTAVIFPGTTSFDDRTARGYAVAGPLASGITRAAAQDEVSAVMRELAAAYPRSNRDVTADVLPFWDAPRGPQRLLAASVGVLQTVMLLLLLAVCGNTTNLLLARASARQREMGIRMALGAGRVRIASLLLAENMLLAVLGGALGAAIAVWGVGAISAVPPLRVRGIPVSFATGVDGATLAFAIGLGLACGLVSGLLPAANLARHDATAILRSGGSTARRSRLRSALIAVEVGLAMVVLVAAGLFVRSFLETRRENTGFDRHGVLLAGFDLSSRTMTAADMRRFAATLMDRVQALPSVEAVSLASAVPLDIHGMPTRAFALEGRARADGQLDEAVSVTVTPRYFAVMRIPILAGHDFADLLDTAAPTQAIVNDTFVRRFLDGTDPLGRRVEVGGTRYAICGVVKTSIYSAFGEPPAPAIYFSLRDRPFAAGDIHVRVRQGSETAVAADLRRIAAGIDPDLPLYDVRTLGDHIESNLILRRIPARMFAVLGPLLLLLAATGVYAVVAYAVSRRTMEIGVRLALGATSRQVIGQVMGEHLLVVAAGALLGWVAAFAVAMDVVGVPIDGAVFAGVPAVLMLVSTIASWWPARRVARVDPLIALRVE